MKMVLQSHSACGETGYEPCPDKEQVLLHLQQILASPEFVGSPRLRNFLTFVVETALAGNADHIKESLIAVEVYGRRPDYNPQIDSTVRVEAGRLRTRLRQYYESTGGLGPVRISLPKGTYVPEFHTTVVQSVEPPPLVQTSATLPAATGEEIRYGVSYAAAGVVLLIASAILLTIPGREGYGQLRLTLSPCCLW